MPAPSGPGWTSHIQDYYKPGNSVCDLDRVRKKSFAIVPIGHLPRGQDDTCPKRQNGGYR